MSETPDQVLEKLRENNIHTYFHCGSCLPFKPADVSPKKWSMTQTGITEHGFQVWCNRCDKNVVHIDHENKVMA